jgi:O-succinylbenzoate synthase
LHEHAALRAESATPLCLDESITDLASAQTALNAGACDAISVKPSRLGGLDATLHVLELCAQAGIGALAGGMLETGIGRAALLAIAARTECTLTGDLSASDRYFGPDGDITEPFVLVDGQIAVPDGPGLGVAPVPERLAACTIEHERIDRS